MCIKYMRANVLNCIDNFLNMLAQRTRCFTINCVALCIVSIFTSTAHAAQVWSQSRIELGEATWKIYFVTDSDQLGSTMIDKLYLDNPIDGYIDPALLLTNTAEQVATYNGWTDIFSTSFFESSTAEILTGTTAKLGPTNFNWFQFSETVGATATCDSTLFSAACFFTNDSALYRDHEGLLSNDTIYFTDEDAVLVAGAVVPIPPAVWLFGSGLIGLIGIARRKKS